MFGQDVYYIPRQLIAVDEILNEDYSRFADAYVIEMYIETVDGFAGEGDLLSKFGVEIRDQATFVVSRRRWEQLVGVWNNQINNLRPNEGDLIYLPLSNSIFEIRFVEHEQPFYQLSNLPTYKLQCELFEYNQEEIETGIRDIDRIQERFSTQLVMTVTSGSQNFTPGERVFQDTGQTFTDPERFGQPIYVEAEVAEFIRGAGGVPSTLKVVAVRGTDGTDRTFFADATKRINGDDTGAAWVITNVDETKSLDNDTFADNQDFEVEGDSIIDFSETNPFGEP